MTDEPRDRAIRVALALLHQPSAADAAEAWQVVGKLGQACARLRSSIEGEAWTVEPWTAAAAELAQRLEEAAAWWTGRSGFPWSTWDESSAAALGSLLCELDALAATLLTATGSDAAVPPAPPMQSAQPSEQPEQPEQPEPTRVDLCHGHRRGRDIGDGARPALPRRRGLLGGRLIPTVGLAAVAVVGVIGGITIAATQVSHVELPSRSIMSEPVPYTLHDSEPNSAADGSTKAQRPRGADVGADDTGAPTAARNLSLPGSAAGSPSAPGPSAAPSGPVVMPRQGSKVPQPREAGFPPRHSTRPGGDQADTMVSDAGGEAEQLQEAQLRELAKQMENAMGLAIGLRTR